MRTEAAGYLREMGAMHSARAMDAWSRFTKWMFRAHDLLVDEEAARRLRRLDRKYSLLFLFSHRSYLDGAAVPVALDRHGINPAFTLGGANLNFFPVNHLARRSGIVYIRRSTQRPAGVQAGAARLHRPADPQPAEPQLVHRGRADPHRQAAATDVRHPALRGRRDRGRPRTPKP